MNRTRWIDRVRAAGWELVKVEVNGGQVEVRETATGAVVTVGASRRSALMKAINILDKRARA